MYRELIIGFDGSPCGRNAPAFARRTALRRAPVRTSSRRGRTRRGAPTSSRMASPRSRGRRLLTQPVRAARPGCAPPRGDGGAAGDAARTSGPRAPRTPRPCRRPGARARCLRFATLRAPAPLQIAPDDRASGPPLRSWNARATLSAGLAGWVPDHSRPAHERRDRESRSWPPRSARSPGASPDWRRAIPTARRSHDLRRRLGHRPRPREPSATRVLRQRTGRGLRGAPVDDDARARGPPSRGRRAHRQRDRRADLRLRAHRPGSPHPRP